MGGHVLKRAGIHTHTHPTTSQCLLVQPKIAVKQAVHTSTIVRMACPPSRRRGRALAPPPFWPVRWRCSKATLSSAAPSYLQRAVLV